MGESLSAVRSSCYRVIRNFKCVYAFDDVIDKMKALTVTAARRQFGALLNAVQVEAVLVYRKNGDKVVIMSTETYKQMCSITSFEPELGKLIRTVKSSAKSR